MALTKPLWVLGSLLMVLITVKGQCTSGEYNLGEYTLTEGTPAGLIKNLTYEYEMTNENDEKIEKMFTINGTGLYLLKDFNLDGDVNKDLCATAANYEIFVKCKDGTTRGLQPVVIKYTDDFPPMFLNLSYTGHLHEEQQRTMITMDPDKIQATDEDCGISSSQFYYQIETSPDSSLFEIEKNNEEVQVFAIRPLDFEEQSSYTLNISVMTKRSNEPQGRRAYTQLTVRVEDIDDRDPVFLHPTFELEVDEQKNLSSIWLTTFPEIKAMDGDTGINETIVYNISSVTPPLNLEIHNTSGKVRILEELDVDKASVYQVIVQAEQLDKPYKSSEAVLTIKVKDVNNHLPVFPSLTQNLDLMEDVSDGTWVTALKISDDDKGENAVNKLSIHSDDSKAFALKQPTPGGDTWLVVNDTNALNGNTTAHIQIRASPRAPLISGLVCDYISTCVTNVNIRILEVNNHRPLFDLHLYEFAVFEPEQEQSIGHVFATDSDSGENAKVSYKINLQQDNPQECLNAFKMNSTTGEITTTKQILQALSCSLEVTACDTPRRLSERLCTSEPVRIEVSSFAATLNVWENVPVGTILLDLPIDGLSVNMPEFKVKEKNLLTASTLDREKQTSFTIPIVNNVTGKLLKNIHIDIIDVNDNTPIPTDDQNNVTLTGFEASGAIIFTIEADDKDQGKNAEITFSLLNGQDWLSIDPLMGNVSLIKMPTWNDGETVKEVIIKIQDNGTPPLYSLANLYVFYYSPNATASLVLPIQRNQVLKDKLDIMNSLSSVLGLTVTILRVEPLAEVEEIGSVVYIKAQKKNKVDVAPSILNQLLKENAEEIYSLFSKKEADDSDDSQYKKWFIIGISLFGITLLLLIALFCYHCRVVKSNRQQLNIMRMLNQDTKIYDNAGKDGNVKTTANGKTLVPQAQAASTTSNGASRSNHVYPNLAFTNDENEYDNTNCDSANNNNYDKLNANSNGSVPSPDVELNPNCNEPNGEISLDNWTFSGSNNNNSNNNNSDKISESTTQQPSSTPKPFVSTINVSTPNNSTDYVNLQPNTNSSSYSLDAKQLHNSDNQQSENSITTPGQVDQNQNYLSRQRLPPNHLTNTNDLPLPNGHILSSFQATPQEPDPDYAKIVRFDRKNANNNNGLAYIMDTTSTAL